MCAVAEYEGILVIDKDSGPTSHDVISILRRLLNMRRIGHCGTLDPLATGVLVVCLGRYTRLSEWLSGAEKEYVATFQLDAVSDTADLQGVVSYSSHISPPARETIEMALQGLQGDIEQIPPAFSAIKVSGVRSYQLARQHKAVPLPARRVRIRHLQILEYAFPFLSLRIVCSKGTYIRSLAVDLGNLLGCGGLVAQLRRVRAGSLQEQDALSISQVEQAVDHEQLAERFITPRRALEDFPEVLLSAAQLRLFTLGSVVAIDPFSQPGCQAICAICDLNGKFYGIGEWTNGLLKPRKVFVSPSASGAA